MNKLYAAFAVNKRTVTGVLRNENSHIVLNRIIQRLSVVTQPLVEVISRSMVLLVHYLGSRRNRLLRKSESLIHRYFIAKRCTVIVVKPYTERIQRLESDAMSICIPFRRRIFIGIDDKFIPRHKRTIRNIYLSAVNCHIHESRIFRIRPKKCIVRNLIHRPRQNHLANPITVLKGIL